MKSEDHITEINPGGSIKIPTQVLDILLSSKPTYFIVNKGFGKYLNIYPDALWLEMVEELKELKHDRENRTYLMYVFSSATEVRPSNDGKIVIPKALLSYCGIDDKVVLMVKKKCIEIWPLKCIKK